MENREITLRLVYAEERIEAEVRRLADEISADYADEELVLVVVLKGAFIFAADLVRRLRLSIAVDFVELSSYSGTETTGRVSLIKDVEIPLAGKNVLIVEDIVDTGLSLAFLLAHLSGRGAKSLKVCTLIDKRGRRRADATPDYAGIICDDRFLLGYGLDLDERCRELPAIYEIPTKSSCGGLNDSPM